MKKTFLFLFALVAIGLSNVWAYDFEAVAPSGQTLYYNIVNGNAQVTAPDFDADGYEDWGAYTKPTGELSIPESVTYNGTTYSVTSIGRYAFWGCSGLTSVTIPNSVTIIDTAVFASCSGLTSVTIPNSVTTIGYAAFYGCSGLTSVTIPNSVTSIGDRAFQNCSGLTSVTIPNSVTEIGFWAFLECSGLTSVEYTGNIAGWCSIDFGGDYANPNCYAHNLTIGGSPVAGALVIPSGVSAIKNYAFWGCRGLTSVTIPNSVTSIGNYAFYECSGLTSVTIPNSVTSIGAWTFYECSGLTEITSEARVAPQLDVYVFDGVNSDITINIPCNSLAYYVTRWQHFYNFVEGTGFAFVATSSNPAMGSVVVLNQPSCGAPQAVVNAVAASGYQFDRWSNGETQNPYSLTLTKDSTLTAYFAVEVRDTVFVHDTTIVNNYIHDTTIVVDSIPYAVHDTTIVTVHDTVMEQLTYYTMTIVSGNTTLGLVAGNGSFPVGTEVEIAAIPVEGNHFVQWNDQSTDNPRRVTVTENATYVATFEPNATQGVADVLLNNYSVSTREGMIVVKDAEGEQLRVFDVTGRLLHQGKIENAEWHVGVKSAGAYFVQVGGGVAQKVIVVK